MTEFADVPTAQAKSKVGPPTTDLFTKLIGGGGQLAPRGQSVVSAAATSTTATTALARNLWEGRYKACPVDCDSYLLRCHRYIELNPVRAAMVIRPTDFRWSSHRANALGQPDPLLTPHPGYLALGADPVTRQQAYRNWVAEAIAPEELELIRLRLQRQHALGPDRFRRMIEAQLERRAGPAPIGRPRKARPVSESA